MQPILPAATAGAPARGRSFYALVWRLHFYAGLFCIPFLLWLSLTGPLYLFKPQIDAWEDRPYDRLAIDGPLAAPSAQVQAALDAVPGAVLNAYEMPSAPNAAPRVLVVRGTELFRVYVHPQTLAILKTIRERARTTRWLFYLHGEMQLGTPGSMAVELAGCWAVAMILTGFYLWWPRGARGLGGILYPRLALRGRMLWRDIHAVAGFWVSVFALFLLITGLPWAASWGGMLKDIRQIGRPAPVHQDWTTGSASEAAEHRADSDPAHAGHHHGGGAAALPNVRYGELDALVPVVAPLNLAAPALIAPPNARAATWTARSEAQIRPLRESLVLDGAAGRIVSRKTFADWPLIDRLVGYGVAIHEGHMFGWLNMALGLFTALALLAVGVSGGVMWWQRRPAGRLGAPPARRSLLGTPLLLAGLLALGVLLPLMGASLLLVLALDRWLFPRIPRLARFLGTAGQTA